ncbi:hypothetical protein [Erythrobacter sp. EC-HK427]|uniref:hypothetical protein n=1 Tax=Erythrobacter sp. EC-HK427 TaxID=2038396 RepID=UPI0012552805|nr:hypothetical protein [Erythrobacter sp. EC-HK427]VVT02128.1 conserved membrane hypothetical protein [Erythrobacter sp. EC-HK427]
MTSARPIVLARKFAPFVLPVIAIGLARLMTYTDWAAANATLAALLFAWIVMDALCLATIAKAVEKKPAIHTILGAAALGVCIVIIGASPAVRARIFELPALLTALGLTAMLWFAVAARRVTKAWRDGADIEAALSEVMPGPFLKFFLTEVRMMHLALFVWNGKPDVPKGAQAFGYHRYLAPMMGVFIALQVIELGVVHLLLSLWSPFVAWLVFAPTLAGLLWFIALTKSLRLNPVLLTQDSLRVRTGILHDCTIPLDAIASIGETFDAKTLKARSTLDTAIMSAPNVTLRLARPVEMPGLIGTRTIDRVALRLDEPAAFQAALRKATGL